MNKKIECIWEKLKKDSSDAERNMSSLHRKQTGSYYTSLDLAYEMMEELVKKIKNDNDFSHKKFLEPCVGTGNFVFAYLRSCFNLKLSSIEYKSIIENIYVCDINEKALKIYQDNLTLFAKEVLGIDLEEKYFTTHIGKGLLVNLDSNVIEYISLESIFSKEVIGNGFDIVVTNPPYKNLKAEKTHYESDLEKEKDREKYKKISEIASNYFPYSSYGTLNIYKMFVEEILEKYSNDNGFCYLLIPSSILSDKNCCRLRTRIIEKYSLISIYIIPENSNYVDASQALCALLISKRGNTNVIKIKGGFSNNGRYNELISVEDIRDDSTGNSILILSPQDREKKKQMEKFPKLKTISSIKNLRGELDITLNKSSIIYEKTPFRFYRGRNIAFYSTVETNDKEYVINSFVKQCTKSKYIFMKRLACQQIANMSKKKRIAFTLVNENVVLGNSCNFIAVENDKIDIYFLLGILNSDLIEWYFNLTSSNNHINNYEIDNFPIPINYENKDYISSLVKKYISSNTKSLLKEIENEVEKAYGIRSNENE